MQEINSGIYAITNMVNGKKYIGSSKSINKRWWDHRKTLRKNCHHSIKLQNAWNKYGEDSFVFSIVEVVEDIENLIGREQVWMDLEDCVNNGYNIRPIADSCLGIKRSEETKEKIREIRTGTKSSEEAKSKISLSLMGNTRTLGYKHTEESKAKMSASRLGNTYCLGKKASEETRAKLSQALMGNTRCRGRTLSDDHKSKIAETSRGRAHTDEAKEKIAASKRGKKRSAEDRARMVEGRRLAREKREMAKQLEDEVVNENN